MRLIIFSSNPDDRALQLEVRVMGSSRSIPSKVNLDQAVLISDQDWSGNVKNGYCTFDNIEGGVEMTDDLVELITDPKNWKKHENYWVIDKVIEVDTSSITYTA